ncbi:MAG: hypothetical protein WHV66_10070 [Anaerolineales bacterium]
MLSQQIPETSLILVAVLPSPRDLEIARVLGWYRMPLRSAPKVVTVDYLAFYQPATFGVSHRWRIEYYAAVRGHELTTRQELFKDEPEHPRAHEEYYKVQLGPLQQLATPILSERWRRLTFLYTTGALFMKARTVEELVVRSEERAVLWHSLRDRAISNSTYLAQELPELALDPAILLMLGDFSRLKELPSEDYRVD